MASLAEAENELIYKSDLEIIDLLKNFNILLPTGYLAKGEGRAEDARRSRPRHMSHRPEVQAHKKNCAPVKGRS